MPMADLSDPSLFRQPFCMRQPRWGLDRASPKAPTHYKVSGDTGIRRQAYASE